MNDVKYKEIINTYGVVAYLKLVHLAEFLAEKNIDIRNVNKKQIMNFIHGV